MSDVRSNVEFTESDANGVELVCLVDTVKDIGKDSIKETTSYEKVVT